MTCRRTDRLINEEKNLLTQNRLEINSGKDSKAQTGMLLAMSYARSISFM